VVDFLKVYEAVAARLQPLREEVEAAGLLVRAIAGDESIGREGGDNKGSVYFFVATGRSQQSEVIGVVIQTAVFVLKVVVETPSHYGEQGSLYLTQRCLELLVGFKVPQGKRGLYFLEMKTFRDRATWIIELDFALEVVLQEALEEQYEPLLKTIIYTQDDQEFVRVEAGDLPPIPEP